MKFSYPNRMIVLAGALFVTLFLLGTQFFSKPRVLAVNEVPIAFWSWRTRTPSAAEVHKAFKATNAETLFLRSGQFDIVSGDVQRIRPVSGSFPRSVELHLVYNGTRKFLGEWDQLEPIAIAMKIADTYQTDLSRTNNDLAEVKGLQLDFDVPTRLLPKYAQVLKGLRALLPPNTKISITGLPTWSTTENIKPVLAAVDFWIPQCYGGTIPIKVGQQIPISSPTDVERTIVKIRQLNKPFYAGLSAYSYAILYAKEGGLLEIRGDIDPDLAVQSAGLELTETGTFNGDVPDGEFRYVYRAKNDVVLDGLIVKPGETLVFDLPNAASLRAGARAVRENAGDLLLGICLFRLPTSEDATTLSVAEIAAAVTDTQTKVATTVSLERLPDGELKLRAENTGDAHSLLSEDAMTIDLTFPPGGVQSITGRAGFTACDTLCGQGKEEKLQPCSSLRANVIRLKARTWNPGTTAAATFSLKNGLPLNVPALVTSHLNDGRIEQESLDLEIQYSEK